MKGKFTIKKKYIKQIEKLLNQKEQKPQWLKKLIKENYAGNDYQE